MMHILPCHRVRHDLPAFHDGELPIEDQVLIQGHLKECVSCRLEAHAYAQLSDALRTMAGSVPGRAANEGDRIVGAVLERIRVERQFSLASQMRSLFEDMHLVWAGLGASLAMLFCIFASAGVLQAASQENPDSLAGIISTIAHADMNDPVRLAGTMIENRVLLDTTAAMQATDEDAELMISAVVTRDGRIQNLALLEEQARALPVKPEVVLAMLDAASRARFEPSQIVGYPNAVNVVWLMTTTRVKGQPDYDLYLLNPPQRTAPAGFPQQVPKRTEAPPAKSTTASDDGLTTA